MRAMTAPNSPSRVLRWELIPGTGCAAYPVNGGDTMLSLADLRVEDVMTCSPFCLGLDDLLIDAYARLMKRNLSGAPVTARDNEIVGVVSVQDLLSQAMAVFDPATPAERLASMRNRTLEAVIRRSPVTCQGAEPLAEVCKLMVKSRIHRVVVVDSAGKPCGLLSAIDVVRAVACMDEE